jgi:hypothetical protein
LKNYTEINTLFHAVSAIIVDNYLLMKTISTGTKHNHTQLINKLKVYIKSQLHGKLEFFESIEDDVNLLEKINEIKKASKYSIEPNLPIDLISIEKIQEKTENGKKEECSYYTIYFIVSTINIPDSLEYRITFYKFYLSRVISTKRLKIVLIAQEFSNEIKSLFTNKVNGLKENGIGLWIIDNIKDTFIEKNKAYSHREVMENEFN